MKHYFLFIIFFLIITFPIMSEEALTVTEEGNVGIGTETPDEKLDVNGNMNVSGTVTAGGDVVSEGRIKDKTGDVVPVGTIVAYAGDSIDPPEGWLYCDGSSVSSLDYPDLYQIISTYFGDGVEDGKTGGAGTGDFNIPDLRGMFLRGADNGTGRDPDAGARVPLYHNGATGDNVGSSQSDEIESHDHTMNHDHDPFLTEGAGEHSHSGSVTVPRITSTGTYDSEDGFYYYTNGVTSTNYPLNGSTSTVEDHSHQVDVPEYVGDTGNTGGNETRPMNVYVNFIIKY